MQSISVRLIHTRRNIKYGRVWRRRRRRREDDFINSNPPGVATAWESVWGGSDISGGSVARGPSVTSAVACRRAALYTPSPTPLPHTDPYWTCSNRNSSSTQTSLRINVCEGGEHIAMKQWTDDEFEYTHEMLYF